MYPHNCVYRRAGDDTLRGFPQAQQAGIGGLRAAVKIHCESLAVHGWQVEGKRRIVGHGGRGVGLIAQGSSIGHRFAT